MNMITRTITVVAFASLLAATATPRVHANGEMSRTQYLTLTRPVALPGVALHARTYIFEMPERNSAPHIVRVMRRDRKIVYLTAFTREIDQPSTVPAAQCVASLASP